MGNPPVSYTHLTIIKPGDIIGFRSDQYGSGFSVYCSFQMGTCRSSDCNRYWTDGRLSLIHILVKVHYDEGHYVLLTGEKGGNVRMFAPYYREEAFTEKALLLVKDHPFCYNL